MSRYLLTFIVSIVGALSSLAQDVPLIDPPDLLKLRDEHTRAMQRQAIPLLTAYVRKLESQKIAFTRQGNLVGALATDRELKLVTKQLETANSIASGAVAAMNLSIISVIFGEQGVPGRTRDVTKGVKKVFESGAASVTLHRDSAAFGKTDPSPGKQKTIVITYMINGLRKERTFKEEHILKFKEDLN